jgi:hypothetical protein
MSAGFREDKILGRDIAVRAIPTVSTQIGQASEVIGLQLECHTRRDPRPSCPRLWPNA